MILEITLEQLGNHLDGLASDLDVSVEGLLQGGHAFISSSEGDIQHIVEHAEAFFETSQPSPEVVPWRAPPSNQGWSRFQTLHRGASPSLRFARCRTAAL